MFFFFWFCFLGKIKQNGTIHGDQGKNDLDYYWLWKQYVKSGWWLFSTCLNIILVGWHGHFKKFSNTFTLTLFINKQKTKIYIKKNKQKNKTKSISVLLVCGNFSELRCIFIVKTHWLRLRERQTTVHQLSQLPPVSLGLKTVDLNWRKKQKTKK